MRLLTAYREGRRLNAEYYRSGSTEKAYEVVKRFNEKLEPLKKEFPCPLRPFLPDGTGLTGISILGGLWCKNIFESALFLVILYMWGIVRLVSGGWDTVVTNIRGGVK